MILKKTWEVQKGSKRYAYDGWFLLWIIPLYVVRYGSYVEKS